MGYYICLWFQISGRAAEALCALLPPPSPGSQLRRRGSRANEVRFHFLEHFGRIGEHVSRVAGLRAYTTSTHWCVRKDTFCGATLLVAVTFRSRLLVFPSCATEVKVWIPRSWRSSRPKCESAARVHPDARRRCSYVYTLELDVSFFNVYLALAFCFITLWRDPSSSSICMSILKSEQMVFVTLRDSYYGDNKIFNVVNYCLFCFIIYFLWALCVIQISYK